MKNILKPAVLAIVTSTMLTGCIGQFALTDNVYEWNKKQGNKWVAEGLFLVMTVIPVYGATLLIDGVVLNSIEFWTKTNPISNTRAVVQTKTTKTLDGSTVTMTYHPDGKINVDYKTLTGKEGAFTLTKSEDSVSMLDQDGKLVATADAEGQLTL